MTTSSAITELSRHVDAMEILAEDEFSAIAEAPKAALCNILVRLGSIKHIIEFAARK